MRTLRVSWIILLAFLSFVSPLEFALANPAVTYQGRILKPDGSPLEGANVSFKLQIRSPGSQNCLMYEEVQALDMRDSHGLFSIAMNSSTSVRTDSSGQSLDQIFANKGTFNFASGCAIGNSYTPNPGDNRKLLVQFKDETMGSYEPMPPTSLNFVPFAIESRQVEGFRAESLVRVQNADGTMGNIAPLSNANYLDLLNLIGGTSPNYVRASNGAGARVPVVTGNPLSPVAGSVWFDSVSGKLKFHDGSSAVDVGGGGGGGVTSVTAGSGLVTSPGAGITATGSIAIAVGGVVTNMLADGSVTTIKIGDSQVTDLKLAANSVIEAKIANGAVTSAKILDGTIAGVDLAPDIVISTTGSVTASGFTTTGNVTVGGNVTVTGDVRASSVDSGLSATRQLQLFDPDPGSVNKITFTADAALNADYTLKWPLTAGSANQVLSTDGLGNLSWVNASSGADNLGNHTATQNIQLGNHWLSGDGGNEGLRVDANGNVGIGTTAPAAALDVGSGSIVTTGTITYPGNTSGLTFNTAGLATFTSGNAGSTGITVRNTLNATGAGATLYFANATVIGAAVSSVVTGATASDDAMTFSTRGSNSLAEWMRITSTGNVGIGATSPQTKLAVNGIISPSVDSTHSLGNSSYRFTDVYATGSMISTSDGRSKTNIQDSDLGLDFITNLRPVSYNWKEGDQTLHYGVIAQETEAAIREAKTKLGRTNEADGIIVNYDEKADRYGVKYTELIAPIIKAIQELNREVFRAKSDLDSLKSGNTTQLRSITSKADKEEVEALKTKNARLEKENIEMKARLDKIEKILKSKTMH